MNFSVDDDDKRVDPITNAMNVDSESNGHDEKNTKKTKDKEQTTMNH